MPWYRAIRHVTHGNAAGSHVCPPGTLIELPEGEAGDAFERVDASAVAPKVAAPAVKPAPEPLPAAPVAALDSSDVETPVEYAKRGRRKNAEE